MKLRIRLACLLLAAGILAFVLGTLVEAALWSWGAFE